MKALTQLWRTTGHRVVPLAPSAAAADVLRDELGCRTENLHKFHHTHTSERGDRQGPTMSGSSSSPATWSSSTRPAWPAPGTSTGSPRYARERGALVRLLGDPAQLSSVEAGGALGLLAGDTNAVELTQLHRFDDPAEAAPRWRSATAAPRASPSTKPMTGSAPGRATISSTRPSPPGRTTCPMDATRC